MAKSVKWLFIDSAFKDIGFMYKFKKCTVTDPFHLLRKTKNFTGAKTTCTIFLQCKIT